MSFDPAAQLQTVLQLRDRQQRAADRQTALAQRQEDIDRQARQREEDRRAQRVQQLTALGISVAQQGGDPAKVIAGFDAEFPTNRLEALSEISKMVKKNAAQQEQQIRGRQAIGAERTQRGTDIGNLAQLQSTAQPAPPTGPLTELQSRVQAGQEALQPSPDEQARLGVLTGLQEQHAAQLAIPKTEFERALSTLPAEEQQMLREQFARRLARGSGGRTIRTRPDGSVEIIEGGDPREISGFQQQKLFRRAQNTQTALDLLDGTIKMLEADPSREGFAATFRNTISRTVGLLESTDRIAGTNLVQTRVRDPLAEMAKDKELSREARGLARATLRAVDAGDLAVLDTRGTLLKLRLVEAFRPTDSRSTNQLFQTIDKMIDASDKRNVTVDKLNEIRSQLEVQQRNVAAEREQFGPSVDLPAQRGAPGARRPGRNQIMVDGVIVDIDLGETAP